MTYKRIVRQGIARSRAVSMLAIGFVTTVVGACDSESGTPVAPPNQISRHVENAIADDVDLFPGEAADRAVAAAIPDYAGAMLNEDGELVIRATSNGREAEAGRLLLSARGETGISSLSYTRAGSIRTGELAEYSFAQLAEWRSRVFAFFAANPASAYLDLHEGNNRLEIGVASWDAVPSFRAHANSQGVPTQAVHFAVSSKATPQACTVLNTKCRPLTGGTSMHAPLSGQCTLGPTAFWAAGPGVLTNSHCSATTHALDGGSAWQPIQFPGDNRDMFEVWDRAGFFCGTPTLCRYADLAIYAVDFALIDTLPGDGFPWQLRRIARTQCTDCPNSKAVDAANPLFNVLGTQDNPILGAHVYKIGQTTGWTSGFVMSTCVAVPAQSRLFLCQSTGSYASQQGDSGSPILMPTQTFNNVYLIGMNWGRHDPTNVALFSNIGGIRLEIQPSFILF